MKKITLKLISVLLAVVLLFVAMPTSVFAQNTEKGAVQIGVMTDLHYYAQANIDDKDKATEVCEKTICTSHLADAILMTALDFYKVQAEQGKLDYLIIPGDLTKDGDYVSHVTLAGILENWEKETGVPVLVTNGNHDINNHSAQVFENGKFVKGARYTTPEEFREIYAELGYDLAVEEFTPPAGEKAGALSYVAQLDNGYRLVVIDGGVYSADITESGLDEKETRGKYSDAVFEWAVEQIEESTENGYSVIGMTHWNLVPHYHEKELVTFTDFLIEDCEYVSEVFADAGMQYIFTGHLHIHDIAQHVSDNGNILYDVATASVINFPNLIRMVTFDNTQDGVLTADIESHDFDELKPLEYNGRTYEQPFKDYCFSINFVGDSAKGMLMDLAGYYVEVYGEEIRAAGGLYNFLCEMLGLEELIDGLLGGGIGFAGITLIGTDNVMGLIKDLCDQLDKAYIEDTDVLMDIVSELLDNLLNIQFSDVPCTKFIDKYGFGDATKGGTFGDFVSSVLVYMYSEEESFEDDAFMLDMMKQLDTGEGAVSSKLLDGIIEYVLNDFLLGELLSTLELNITSAFPFGSFGFGIAKTLDIILRVVMLNDMSFTNIVDTVFVILNVFGVLDQSTLNGLLEHLMEEYLTTSQMETIDWEIASFVNGLCVEDDVEDHNLTLTANTNGGYEVVATADNLRLPSTVAVTFGSDASSSRNISWYTKKSVDGTDVEISLDKDNLTATPDGVEITAKTELVRREMPGIDIGLAGLLTYEFDVNRHYVAIEGLEPGTTYYYRIGDAAKGFWSDVATITTADNSDSFTFFHVSDSQGGAERHYDKWANVLDTAFTMYPDAAFLMHTGDHVDHGDNFKQWKWVFNSASDRLMSSVLMPTAGNHENHGEFAIDDNFILSNVPEQDTTTGTYYSFDYNNAHFIVLNSNEDEDNGISQEQIEWMKADAAASDAEWKFVMLHKAPYSNGSHYDDDDVVELRKVLSTLMPELGIDMVLQGHDHVYLRTDAMNNNEVVEVYEMSVDNNGKTYTAKVNPDGTIYAINGCSGVKYYQTKDPADTDKLFPRAEAIVDATYPVFASIRIEGDSLYFDSYAVTEDGAECIDSFAIVKDSSIDTPKYEPNRCPIKNWFAA
ncbi:MAG: metallophosphoesterase [Clostridia bacterium]|nr:metallophosphoesterase [Clostridia bacterium]